MDSPSKLTVVQTLETAPRSRTMTLDPVTHKIYLAAVKVPPPDLKADSFRVLVFAPQ
jgi:hypothetical protein